MATSSLLIENPLPFMLEAYMKKNVLKGKYSSGKINILEKDGLPSKIVIHFEKDEQLDSFQKEFENKFFDDKIDYQLQIKKTDKTLEQLQQELASNHNELVPFIFDIPYENEWKINYVNSPEKEGLLYINEEDKKKIYRTITYLLGKFGKNIFEGKSIMNTSFPIFLYDKRTYLQVFAYEHRYAPYFFSRVLVTKDKMEKLKWLTIFIISYLHLSVIQQQPFKPVIGETFQCVIGDLYLYLENTEDKPFTTHYYGYDEKRNYKIYGHLISDISTAPNSISSSKCGKYIIEFKDGNKYLIKFPSIVLKGIAMGDRLFNYNGKIVVTDLTNNLSSFIELNPDELGFFKSFFSKKKTFPDYFKGQIVDSSNIIIDEKGSNHTLKKGAKEYCKIDGEWTSSCRFDDVEYWDIEEYGMIPMNHMPGYLCPSDGSLRPDLINLIKNEDEKSQTEKEKIEMDEIKDQELRNKYSKK